MVIDSAETEPLLVTSITEQVKSPEDVLKGFVEDLIQAGNLMAAHLESHTSNQANLYRHPPNCSSCQALELYYETLKRTIDSVDGLFIETDGEIINIDDEF